MRSHPPLLKEKTYPLSPAQQWLLSYFSPPYEWYDRMLFTIKGPISFVVMQKAFEYLIDRHDGLRTIFSASEDGRKQQIVVPKDKVRDIPIVVFPWENVLEHTYSKRIDQLSLKLCQEFDIAKWPLCRMVILKRSADEHEIMFLFHHIIVDYFSCIIIFKEFYAVYFALLKGDTPSLPECAMNTEYGSKIEASIDVFSKIKWQQFWDTTLFQVAPTLNFYSPTTHKGETNKPFLQLNNSPSLENFATTLERTISPCLAEILLRGAKQRFKTKSLHFILAAPLYRTLHNFTGQEQVIVSHKLHGRGFEDESAYFYSAVGNFAINVPLVGEINAEMSWPSLIQQLEKKFAQLPLKGLSYDLIHSGQKTAHYPDHVLTAFRFNFVGNISFVSPQEVKLSFKEIARRVVNPSQPLTTYVEFFIHFFEKTLYLEVRYDGLQIDAQFLCEIVDAYLSDLTDLINFLQRS